MGETSLQSSSIMPSKMFTQRHNMANYYWKMLTTQAKWKTIWRDIRAHKGQWPVGVTTRDRWYKLAVAVYQIRAEGR